MEPLISIENNFEEEEIDNKNPNKKMQSKEVIKIDDLLIEIENKTDAIQERKPVDVKMQPIFIFTQVENKLTTKNHCETLLELLQYLYLYIYNWLQYLYYMNAVRLFIRAERNQLICLPIQGILTMLSVPGCICKTSLS